MAKTSRQRQGPPPKKAAAANSLVPYVRYSRPLAGAIIERLAAGEAWSRICREPEMPSYGSLYVWRRTKPEFAEAEAIAREMAADRKADRALEVAEGAEATLQGDRLRVTTLMQLAALEAPGRWGGKAPPAGKAEPVEIVFYVRHFEKVIGPDGKAFVREIPREGRS